jgi:hypothetical protein
MAHPLLPIKPVSKLEGVLLLENNQTWRARRRDFPNRDKIRSDVGEVIDKAKNAGREKLESGKQATASQAEKIAEVVDNAASQLKENNLQTLADFASELGTTIKNFSEGLHNRSIDDLLVDIRQIAGETLSLFFWAVWSLGSAFLGSLRLPLSTGTSLSSRQRDCR